MNGVSIVICCYNSAQRLPKTLLHLKQQQVPATIPWEVIVIDNASTDQTRQIAIDIWGGYSGAPLRVVSEPNPGLSNARKCGFEEALYEYISFVDDDNWVASNWIETVFEIMSEHPMVGACGGRSEAIFEIDPPEWYPNFYSRIAVGEQGTVEGDITESHGWLWGAGLTIRKQAWDKLLQKNQSLILSGRRGKVLTSGEDIEICYVLRIHEWKLYYSSRLVLKHFIPSSRLSWDYFYKMVSRNGYTAVVISQYKQYLREPLLIQKSTMYLWIWLRKTFSLGIELFSWNNRISFKKYKGSREYLELLYMLEKLKSLIRMGPFGLYSIDQRITRWNL